MLQIKNKKNCLVWAVFIFRNESIVNSMILPVGQFDPDYF